jgi:DNA repair exonuclease SbcCD ATPase subunit
MTDEEINRKFDMVAEHLASFAISMQNLGEKVDKLAEGQRQTDASIRALLSITEIQAQEIKDLRESVQAVDERQREADERQREADERERQTDERLNALINTFERYISERRNGRRAAEERGPGETTE